MATEAPWQLPPRMQRALGMRPQQVGHYVEGEAAVFRLLAVPGRGRAGPRRSAGRGAVGPGRAAPPGPGTPRRRLKHQKRGRRVPSPLSRKSVESYPERLARPAGNVGPQTSPLRLVQPVERAARWWGVAASQTQIRGRGGRRCGRLQRRSHVADRRHAGQRRGRQPQVQFPLDRVHQAHGQQGMAAQLEEIVGDPEVASSTTAPAARPPPAAVPRPSAGFRGGRRGPPGRRGGKAARSILPEGRRGSASISRQRVGTIQGGRLRRRRLAQRLEAASASPGATPR
jgi:hypothetical protein